MNDESLFACAGTVAAQALCTRAKCGAIIVSNETVIGRGYNAPPRDDPGNRKCAFEYGESRKPRSDRTCCVHAEWRAMLDGLRSGKDLSGADLYFVRVDDAGNLKYSGEPYCTVCSRLALDLGLRNFVLRHPTGAKRYDTREYNDLSYQFHLKHRDDILSEQHY